jgi:hypothetical protein
MSPPNSEIGAQVQSLKALDAPVSYPGKKTPVGLIAGVGIGVLAVIGVVVMLRSNTDSKTAETSAAVSSPAAVAAPPGTGAAQAPAASSPPTSAAAAAPSATDMKLRIAAKPEGARIRVDGRLMKGNPLFVAFPRDDRDHVLTINADNYHEYVETLRFDQDLDLEISLDSTKSGAPRAARATRVVRSSGPATGGGAAAPVLAAPVIEGSRPAAAPRATEPGMDLEVRPSAPVKRNIDEKDPYAQ